LYPPVRAPTIDGGSRPLFWTEPTPEPRWPSARDARV